ncbi:MAG: helix-turn-helix domain-containing protein [Cytophagales bacterium]|nr:helix-turn-helix domain-containing protein [Cytophagales bacterium]MCA6389125.1 helix-turn-helix domain-containing protein [Cytophagales bacterium]MCA6392302.1 helix-turn-helix domain-containing protein [Cytophagales bacterium]MCA6394369.1 helix-turn-helix domain-containing protein [Cytophagales bacterium]MCA6401156.1 helix-turn-helix domain-containing protein [Cytophagales bacterium]
MKNTSTGQVSNIETHSAKPVAEGRADIFKFMPEETVLEIINIYRQLPEGSTSKDLFDALKGKFGYGQLRAVMAYAKSK